MQYRKKIEHELSILRPPRFGYGLHGMREHFANFSRDNSRFPWNRKRGIIGGPTWVNLGSNLGPCGVLPSACSVGDKFQRSQNRGALAAVTVRV
jgi:hypothetical protein